MIDILCVIPSRIGSTRLPRKALLPILGKPMVQLVYENASNCQLFSKVVVATDSVEIAEVIEKINGHVVMTPSNLLTGTDRVALVAKQFPNADVVVNLQGDEPFITATMLEELLFPYLNGEFPEMATLAFKLDPKDVANPGVVKVITNLQNDAIYFSRAAIPYLREQHRLTIPVYHHIGLYAFNKDFLLKFTNLAVTPLELTESLEQLRAIEHGFKIKVNLTNTRTLEINTLDEYNLAKNFILE